MGNFTLLIEWLFLNFCSFYCFDDNKWKFDFWYLSKMNINNEQINKMNFQQHPFFFYLVFFMPLDYFLGSVSTCFLRTWSATAENKSDTFFPYLALTSLKRAPIYVAYYFASWY